MTPGGEKEMNVELLRKIAAVIQEKRGQFDMRFWHHRKDTGFRADALCSLPEEVRISCKTTHCIAGWAQVLAPNRDCTVEAEEDAKRVLGLNHDQASRLFYADHWPKGFGAWKATKRQAAARIEHFIATNGAE
jgi:hypothetical protein